MAGISKKKSSSKTSAKRATPTSAKKKAPAKKVADKRSTAKRATKQPSAKAAAKAAAPKKKAVVAAAPAAPLSGRTISALTRQMVAAAAEACDEKKAEDTRILELDDLDAGFTDFFLITSGTNDRQTQSIADEIEMRMKREFQTYPNSVEGKRLGEWILLDYVDFVVHIFLAEKRAFYDIERLRKSAKTVDISGLRAAAAKKVLTPRTR